MNKSYKINKFINLIFLMCCIFSLSIFITTAEASNSNIDNISNTRALPTSKSVYFKVQFPKYSGKPAKQRYYNDGVYSGWVPLSYWEDLSDKYPKGYVLGHYRGTVSRVAIPYNYLEK